MTTPSIVSTLLPQSPNLTDPWTRRLLQATIGAKDAVWVIAESPTLWAFCHDISMQPHGLLREVFSPSHARPSSTQEESPCKKKITIQEVYQFLADDGKTFSTAEACERYEKEVREHDLAAIQPTRFAPAVANQTTRLARWVTPVAPLATIF